MHWASKNLSERLSQPVTLGLRDVRSSGMDLEEELLPLVGRDALHEYSRRTSVVKFITDGDEHLDAPSDSSCFGPF